MTKIIDLPTTASTDANTYVPVYKDGKTQKVSATALGGGGSGGLSADFTSLSSVASVDGTEIVPVNKPTGTILKTTVQTVLNWVLARVNTWTGSQTFNADIGVVSINTGQLAGLRNKIINGNFRINQRNYSSGGATTANQYTLDRWKVTGTGGITYNTTANKTTVTIPSGQTLQQVIDGANLESATYVLSWEGTAQGRIAGGTYGSSGTVTASVTGGTNTTIEFNTGTVTLVMFEKGTKATPFEYRTSSLELLLSQRYYYRVTSDSTFYAFGLGGNSSITVGRAFIQFPLPMRISPVAVEHTGTATDYNVLHGATTVTTCNVVPSFSAGQKESCVLAYGVASGLTVGDYSVFRGATVGAFLGFSAEL